MTELFYLADGVQARIAPGPQPLKGIGWFLDSISINVPPSHPSSDYLTRDTVGSSVDTDEEVRFSNRSGMLQTALFHLPAENGEWTDWAQVLPPVKSISGQLELCTRTPFVFERTDIRIFDPNGTALAGVLNHADPGHVDACYEIEKDFYILVAGDQYCGWCLRNPLQYLCEHHRDPLLGGKLLTEPNDIRIAAGLVEQYFRWIDLDIAIAADDDPGSLTEALTGLERSAEWSGLHAGRIIAAAVRKTREFMRL